MKKVLFISLLSLLAISCSKESIKDENTLVPVKVHLTNFSISMEEFSDTRATQDVTNYSGVKAVTLAFYTSDGTEVYKSTQLKDDATTYTTFGEFSCNLQIGSYTMVAIARGHQDGDVFTLTSPTVAAYTGDKVRETFTATQSVTVTASGTNEFSATLNRVIAKVAVVSTDNRPASASKVRVSFAKGSKSFNPTTGLATSDGGFAFTHAPSSDAGSPVDVGGYLFLASDEESMNVSIQVLDADDNVLLTKQIENVPFKRNRITRLRGDLFTRASTLALQVENSWLDTEVINF